MSLLSTGRFIQKVNDKGHIHEIIAFYLFEDLLVRNLMEACSVYQ
jgi:hypothetical protein